MLLYGKNSVLERLKANPQSIKKIFIQENFDEPLILNIMKSKNIPSRRVSEKELDRMKRAERAQGVIAEVDKFIYASFEELLSRPRNKQLSFIFLDGITDPQNLGAIIRIAACFGGFAIVIPEHRACEVNETVLAIASGGENFVPISKVANLSNALIKAKEAGYWIAEAVVEGGEDIYKVKFPLPICLVLGSEGKGVRYGVQKQLDLKVTLPMKGAALSFNVAMACAIFCYEITRQKTTLR